MPNPNSLALIVSNISAFIRTDMARSTRLVILIKIIYTLWGRKRILLPVTYLPTNLVYPFTLRITGIKIKIQRIYFCNIYWYIFVCLKCSILFGGRLLASRLMTSRLLSSFLVAILGRILAALSSLFALTLLAFWGGAPFPLSPTTNLLVFSKLEMGIDIGYRFKVNVFLVTILEQMKCPQRTMRFSQKLTAFCSPYRVS